MPWTFTANSQTSTFEPQAADNLKTVPHQQPIYNSESYAGSKAGRVDIVAWGPRVIEREIRCTTTNANRLEALQLGETGTLSDGTSTWTMTLVQAILDPLLTENQDYEFVGTVRFEGFD